ncbi:hypothetical protein PCANC_09930 [Puccinia coronata f. sp. avenae]|uniref:Uncharacterized protein n=1 Tax=Puccinia coronata f. sp. avenae TaxID=200324 RepID=A0A2N5V2X5_9BASI|nr:hypothetical protein PCANC_09930 [Puccinia coronata f. sp. avenae]
MPAISSPFATAQVAPSPTREERTIHDHITANPEQPNCTITGPNGAHHETDNTQGMDESHLMASNFLLARLITAVCRAVLTAVHANSTNVSAAPAVNMPTQASFTINHPHKPASASQLSSRANFALGLFDRTYDCEYLDKMDAAQAYYQLYLN